MASWPEKGKGGNHYARAKGVVENVILVPEILGWHILG